MNAYARSALVAAAICLSAYAAHADEIRLKDGKKLYGVIVGYEDNMFRVKTDYGFVLVEKEKIAAIVPMAATPSAPEEPAKPAKTSGAKPAAQPPVQPSAIGTNEPAASAPAKPKISAESVRPELPTASRTAKISPPAIKSSTPPASPAIAATQLPPPPAEPEAPANKEQIQGNLYTNFSHGFRMYKAPSWDIIEDARRALPNAIVAMGTSNESTLMVVGQEQTKDSLEASANGVEKRLRDIYANYRLISRRQTVVGGAPAVEFKYTGLADEHEWSGRLVVVARGKEVLTMLGMTYADNDLIQIQENVIARAISSTDFNVH